jgi:hypothetical protein
MGKSAARPGILVVESQNNAIFILGEGVVACSRSGVGFAQEIRDVTAAKSFDTRFILSGFDWSAFPGTVG